MNMPTKLSPRKLRAMKCIQTLKKLFPNARTSSLNYSNYWELLVAVMLSARCTDKKVNEITAQLFKKYPLFDDYLRADKKIFEQDIKASGFYRNKTKNILASASVIQEKFNGNLPHTMEELLMLPGVGRKTANVVLGNGFNKACGIAVDTHVRRFAIKLNLTDHSEPQKIERDLMEIIPKKDWLAVNMLFIEYGRVICTARKHSCENHPLSKIYGKAADCWPRSV